MNNVSSIPAVFRRVIVALLAMVPGLMLASTPAHAVSPGVVISQVYGGGGVTYTHDFVELHNNGSTPVNVTGWTVQYASATGTHCTCTGASHTGNWPA